MTWREYHEATKHSGESVRRGGPRLDWANMPDPFRHYEGVAVLDLPAGPPSPDMPALDLLGGGRGGTCARDGATFLSQLFFYSVAISASKRVPSSGRRYALRVNPSSGNLHPTELHFLTRGLVGWPDGLYHYRPSSHMAEQRALGRCDVSGEPAHLRGAARFHSDAPIVFVVTSIAWREAWKYGSRAYRYCLHDAGHAWQAVALSAQAMGCEVTARGGFPDDEVARRLGLLDDEWPVLVMELRGESIPVSQVTDGPEGREQATTWFGGIANRLSGEVVDYPLIEGIHAATKQTDGPWDSVQRTVGLVSGEESGWLGASAEIKLPAVGTSSRTFGEVARSRRSALDFVGGARSIDLPQLSGILAAAVEPLSADFAGRPFIELYLYVHRVDGLEPGLYRYWRARHALEQIKSGDQRVVAAALSLRQDLAGNACVAFSMSGDFECAALLHGERGYRYVHFEAGAIGQRLYLGAVALGLGATGIGAFFDEEVNQYLGLAVERQVVYHFAIGYPVPDDRLEG